MKILFLMPYSPVPPNFGGAMRIYYLLKSLTSEHEVTILTFGTSEQEKLLKNEFEDLAEEIHVLPQPWSKSKKRLAQCYSLFSKKSYWFYYGYSKEMQKKIDELLLKKNYDVVHSEFPNMAQYQFKDDLIKVIDSHNVEYDNFRRMWEKCRQPIRKWFYKKEYKKVFREEVDVLNQQDLFMATSKEDVKILKKHVGRVSSFVVPNGVDTSFFTPSSIEPEPWSLVFTGMMGYTPNNDGMLWFLDEIFPLILEKIPQAKVYIVGNKPPEELKGRQSEQVIVTGFVDDVRPYVWKSSVFVVPLRMGSGTRLKVVEALAMKKPVVSTSIGCEGIEVEHGKTVLIQDKPEKFASEVINLLKDKELSNRLTCAGHDLVTSTYDWSLIGEKMLDIYRSLEKGSKKEQRPAII